MAFPITEGQVTRITLSGKLDYERAPQLMEQLAALRGKDIRKIVFECADLSYISSAGIRAMIFAQQKIGPDVSVALQDAGPAIRDVLEMSGLSDYVEFTSSQEE